MDIVQQDDVVLTPTTSLRTEEAADLDGTREGIREEPTVDGGQSCRFRAVAISIALLIMVVVGEAVFGFRILKRAVPIHERVHLHNQAHKRFGRQLKSAVEDRKLLHFGCALHPPHAYACGLWCVPCPCSCDDECGNCDNMESLCGTEAFADFADFCVTDAGDEYCVPPPTAGHHACPDCKHECQVGYDCPELESGDDKARTASTSPFVWPF